MSVANASTAAAPLVPREPSQQMLAPAPEAAEGLTKGQSFGGLVLSAFPPDSPTLGIF